MQNLSKFDQLIYLTQEAITMPEKQKLKYIKQLFPAYDPKTTYNDDVLTNSKVEEYAYYRSLGMGIEDVAYASGMTVTFITKVLDGEGISLERLVDFAKAETFVMSQMKAIKLKDLERYKGMGATLAFLEKIYPQQYSPKSNLVVEPKAGKKGAKWSVEVHKIKESGGKEKK